jgi:hypothetical protein
MLACTVSACVEAGVVRVLGLIRFRVHVRAVFKKTSWSPLPIQVDVRACVCAGVRVSFFENFDVCHSCAVCRKELDLNRFC